MLNTTSSEFIAKPGQRVRISEFAENPLDGVENNLFIEEQSAPDPSTLKANDVIIAVKSSAVGWVDLLMSSGQYQHMPPLPYTPGLEYSGEIVWSGCDVDPAQVKVGDRVLVDGFVAGPRSPGDYQQYGGFASYAVAPSNAIRTIPDGFSYDQACNLLGSYEPAYHSLLPVAICKPVKPCLFMGLLGQRG